MPATYAITLLGTGSSGGVPRVGGDWGDCDPREPRNRRRRCSALVQKYSDKGVTNVLIDTSPDFREQALDANIGHLDGLIFSHDHADQTHGIDDVRALVLRHRKRIPVYLSLETLATLEQRFAYCFQGAGGYPAILDTQDPITAYEPFSIDGAGGSIEFLPLDMEHGRIRCLGFRIGSIAYCNDVSALPERTLERLADLDVLIIDALRRTPHPTHANLDQALTWIDALKPKEAVLTNMHVDMDYATLKSELPAHVVPGYDGYRIEFT